MSQDDGMDGIDWKARALRAEHSVGVLTAALGAERKSGETLGAELAKHVVAYWRRQPDEAETIWDRDARAALPQTLYVYGFDTDDLAAALRKTGEIAAALAEIRSARNGA